MLNAVELLAKSYRVEEERTRQDLALAESQRRDYQARVGQPFAHADYLDQLAALRDQLKAALSGAEAKDGAPTIAELAERIKQLRAANTIEAAPQRAGTRRTSAEEPVTARILRRAEAPSPEQTTAGAETSPPTGHASLNGSGGRGTHAEGMWQRSLAETARSSGERIREPG